MTNMLISEGQDLIFRNARSHSVWLEKPVDDALLRQVYELTKFGPTSANMCPLRIIFVKSQAAKERLKPAIAESNVTKAMTAPVTAILGMDIRFYEKLPQLFPHMDAKADAEFFAGTTVKSNFLCSLGYGDASKLHPRSPRLTFEEACQVI